MYALTAVMIFVGALMQLVGIEYLRNCEASVALALSAYCLTKGLFRCPTIARMMLT